MGVHIGATWRIPMDRPCAAAMQPFVKLLSLTTCFMVKMKFFNKFLPLVSDRHYLENDFFSYLCALLQLSYFWHFIQLEFMLFDLL